MNPTIPCLRTEAIEALLAGQFTPEELTTTEEHLSRCGTCRQRIERTIGSAEWWQEACQALASGDRVALDDGGSPKTIQPGSSTDQLLSVLGPSDDPRMLGRIGAYEVVGLIGRGGMGVVFKGFDAALNRYVAIKMLLPHLATAGAARKRFAREAQAAAAVVDDHVMPIHYVAEWQGVPYFVMPYTRGLSLQKRLDQEGPLELREILRIGLQTARGLAAAHAQGLVHRDIKPANILLDESVERVALVDFGLARAVDDASLTHSGMLAGTPQYMSPEQARGETVDQRSDLFSLGSVLYAMCTGHAPFRAETSYGVLRRITDEEPRPIRDINPDIPEWLCRIIAKLMSKEPAERFKSAGEVAGLLEECLAHVQRPTEAPLPGELAEPSASPSVSKNSTRKGVFAMIGFIIILALSALMWQGTAPPDISGHWTGEEWSSIVLDPLDDEPNWYTGRYLSAEGDKAGTVQLSWSRLQRRFNGQWKVSGQRYGDISIRATEPGEIRGALTVDAAVEESAAVPRLRDFVWTRKQRTNWLPPEKTGDAIEPADSLPPEEGSAEDVAPSPDVHRLLAMEQQQWEAVLARFREGNASVDEAIRAARELYSAELIASLSIHLQPTGSVKKTEQSALSKYIDRLRHLQSLVENLVAAGRANKTSLEAIEAEILTARHELSPDEPVAAPDPVMDSSPEDFALAVNPDETAHGDNIRKKRLERVATLVMPLESHEKERTRAKYGDVRVEKGPDVQLRRGVDWLIPLNELVTSVEYEIGEQTKEIHTRQPFDYLFVAWPESGPITWVAYQSPETSTDGPSHEGSEEDEHAATPKVARTDTIGLLEDSEFLPQVLQHRVLELGLEHVITLIGSLEGRESVRVPAERGFVVLEPGEAQLMELTRSVDSAVWYAGDERKEIRAREPFNYLLAIRPESGPVTWAAYRSSGRARPTSDTATDGSELSADYRSILGVWEVVSVEGDGGRFMSLSGQSQPGDRLVIAHVETPDGRQRLWLSEELRRNWSRDDSLHLHPEADPSRLTYKARDASDYKTHFGDPDNPPHYGIYRIEGDELTIVAGDPHDFEVRQGVEAVSGDTVPDGTDAVWDWKITIPDYPRAFRLEEGEQQIMVKLRRISETGDVQGGVGRDFENTAERVAARVAERIEELKSKFPHLGKFSSVEHLSKNQTANGYAPGTPENPELSSIAYSNGILAREPPPPAGESGLKRSWENKYDPQSGVKLDVHFFRGDSRGADMRPPYRIGELSVHVYVKGPAAAPIRREIVRILEEIGSETKNHPTATTAVAPDPRPEHPPRDSDGGDAGDDPTEPAKADVPDPLPRSSTPQAEGLVFSETRELVISMDSMKYMLDLDTGDTMDPPATIRPEQKQMDLRATQWQPYEYPTGLTGLSLRGLKVKASDWNASAWDVHRALHNEDVGLLSQMDHEPEKPTYIFRTREGKGGILQILGLVEEPKGIRVRYKTVEAPAAVAPATEGGRLDTEQPIPPEGASVNEPARSANDLQDLSSMSLAAAAASFNQETAEVRTELFEPDISGLSAERLREGVAQAAATYRELGKHEIADALEEIAEEGQLPKGDPRDPSLAWDLRAAGTIGRDENGEIVFRQVVPSLYVPKPGGDPSQMILVPLRSLELIHKKGGPSSRDYGDLSRELPDDDSAGLPFTETYDVSDIPVSERDELRTLIRRLAMYPSGVSTVSNLAEKPDQWFVFTTADGHSRVRDRLAAWRNGDHTVPPNTPDPPVVDVEPIVQPSPSAEPDNASMRLRFSEARELVLSMGNRKFMLDLDTGDTMDPPATRGRYTATMDVHATQWQPYLYPTGLSGAPAFFLSGSRPFQGRAVKSSDWNATAAEVHRRLAEADLQPLTEMTYAPSKPLYLFRTSEGTEGILQLLDLVEDAKGIRIRYKTVQDIPASPPGSTVPSTTDANRPRLSTAPPPRVDSEASQR